jgi:hypothetical protein
MQVLDRGQTRSNELGPRKKSRKKKKETYNTEDSLVVTHPTTDSAVAGLSMGERTGSRIFQCLWSYVPVQGADGGYMVFMVRAAVRMRPRDCST